MSLFDQVERALHNAVPVPPTGPIFPPSEGFAKYADAPDTEPIHLNPNFTDKAHAAYADAQDPQGLETLFWSYAAIGGLDSSIFKEDISHEHEHWEMAQLLGATAGRFGVQFAYGERADYPGCNSYAQPFLQVHSLHTTKLGLALLAISPKRPSEGDLGAIRKMNYIDIDDIAARAQRLNDQGVLLNNDRPYPIPTKGAS